MAEIPLFSESDRRLVGQTLRERYGETVAVDAVEVAMERGPGTAAVDCPALYWAARGAEFVVARTDGGHYAARFFYATGEPQGTVRPHYDTLGDCVIAILQAQADDEHRRAAIAASQRRTGEATDDLGPIII